MTARMLLLCAFALAVATAPACAQARLNVVATFSILGDFARNVGGDRVNVVTLVGPNSDTHVYTPTPEDAKRVSEAKLVIVNGLGLEGWLPRLVKSAGAHATIVTVTKGIEKRNPRLTGAFSSEVDAGSREENATKQKDRVPSPFNRDGKGSEDHSDEFDPHAWQAVPNAKIYVANIRDAMIAADPEGLDIYRANASTYLAQLDALDREVRDAVAKIPQERRKVISTHNAFGYFSAAYGVAFIAPQGVSTETEVSAGDIAALIRQIKGEKIPAVFLENITDPRLMRQIASETGARIGGTLYSDSLTDEKGDAPTYIEMVRHNTKVLISALL